MSESMRHAEFEELLGAYALDAVDGDEAEAVELHLRDCVRCRAEVAGHREMATLLAHSGTPAPEGLWDRIAREIGDAPSTDAPILRFSTGKQRPPTTWISALAVAAAVIVVLGFQVVRLNQKVQGIPAALSSQSVNTLAQAALLDPDSQRVRLQPTSTGPAADAVILRDGHGYLIMKGQQALPYDRTYQLWAVTPGGTVSLGVLGSSPDVVAFSAAGDVQALAVTVERSGGVISSDQQPVLAGQLRHSA